MPDKKNNEIPVEEIPDIYDRRTLNQMYREIPLKDTTSRLLRKYFAAMANGNSKIYHSDDMIKFAQRAGLKISQIHDGLGVGHTLLCCERAH